jgi:hypothetical protein
VRGQSGQTKKKEKEIRTVLGIQALGERVRRSAMPGPQRGCVIARSRSLLRYFEKGGKKKVRILQNRGNRIKGKRKCSRFQLGGRPGCVKLGPFSVLCGL